MKVGLLAGRAIGPVATARRPATQASCWPLKLANWELGTPARGRAPPAAASNDVLAEL